MMFLFFWLGCSEFEGNYAIDDDGFSEFEGGSNDQDSRIHTEMEEICDGDDNNEHNNPDGIEVCDEVDNDCDEVDEDFASDGTIYYLDLDSDGFGQIYRVLE